MRGLLFTGGKLPEMHIALPFMKPYSFVVAADSGLLGAEKAGILPDIIVGDMDSLPNFSILDKYPKEKKRIWPKDKDFTDTELALQLMQEKGVDEVVLIGGSGGRLDHLFALKALFEAGFCPSIWIGEENIVLCLEGGTLRANKRIFGLGANDPVSIFPCGAGLHACNGKGFHWPVDSLDWQTVPYSLSNRADSGYIELDVLAGRFLLVLPLHSAIRIGPVSV
jgi:thiamine pyrophosphokinase